MAQTFLKDGKILWLQVALEGTPPAWSPGTNYKLGDAVVPTTPISGLENFMFKCVGFIGKSAGSAPTFPLTLGAQVIDNNIVWTCRDPLVSPPQLAENEYYAIDEEVTAT
jgi:hypothetical protein